MKLHYDIECFQVSDLGVLCDFHEFNRFLGKFGGLLP